MSHNPCARPDVRRLVTRLYKARELDRREERWQTTRVRYRYFRRQLEGPIAELERTLHEDRD